MISEGSCDTEDWSNDAENSAFYHRNKLHFKIYLINILSNNISQYYSFCCSFDQLNAPLMSIRYLFNNIKKKPINPNK